MNANKKMNQNHAFWFTGEKATPSLNFGKMIFFYRI